MAVRDEIYSKHEKILANVLFARVPPSQERSTPYQLLLTRRGKYTIGSAEITTRFPLGFVERGNLINTEDELIVHPRTGNLAQGWKRKLLSQGETTEQKKLQLGGLP